LFGTTTAASGGLILATSGGALPAPGADAIGGSADDGPAALGADREGREVASLALAVAVDPDEGGVRHDESGRQRSGAAQYPLGLGENY
jgi:hypothetical protein